MRTAVNEAGIVLYVARCRSGNPKCGWAPHQTFSCACCGDVVCYCEGCSDENKTLAEFCDVCWFAVTHSKLAAGVARKLGHEIKPVRHVPLELRCLT